MPENLSTPEKSLKELKENKDYMKNIYERVTRLKEKEENQIRR